LHSVFTSQKKACNNTFFVFAPKKTFVIDYAFFDQTRDAQYMFIKHPIQLSWGECK